MRNSSLHTLRSVPITYAAIIAVVAAGVGYAADIKVTSVEVNGRQGRRVNPGGTVHVGAAWGASGTTPDVTASVDGKDATVLAADAEFVSVQIAPDQSAGKARLRIVARGKGEATVELEIVKEAIDGNEGRGGTAVGAPDPSDLARASFEITKLTLVSTPTGKQMEAEGKAPRLPNGFNIVVAIGLDGGPPIEPRQTQVTGGAWKVSFGPWTSEVPFGAWRATLLFELGKQGKLAAKRFAAALPENEKTAFDHIERQEVMVVGTDEEKATQTRELKGHAKTLVTLVTRLFDDVDKAYVSGSRCFFRNPAGGIVDAKWEAWLKEQKLIADTPEALVAAKNDNRFARNGHFQVDAWAKWATEVLLPPLAKARQDHEDFTKRWFTPPDPTVERLEGELLTLVGERLRNTGQALCDQTKVPLPPAVLDMLPTTNAGQDQVTRQAFEAKCRLLLRTLGEVVPE